MFSKRVESSGVLELLLLLLQSLNSGDSDYRGTVLYSGYLVVNLFQILLYCWPSNVLMEKVS